MRPAEEFNNRIDQLVLSVCGGNNSEFAKLIGTNETSVRNYRANRSNPPLATVLEIIQKTNVNPMWLFYGTGDMFNEGDSRKPVITSQFSKTDEFFAKTEAYAASDKIVDLLVQERDRLIERNKMLEGQIAKLQESMIRLQDTLANVQAQFVQYLQKN